MRTKYYLLLILIVFSFLTAGADTFEPEEPEIVLPPMLLQIEDIEEEVVDAVIPDNSEMDLPGIDLVLPEAGELTLPQAVFDIPIPDQVMPGVSGDVPFFSEGMIGFGTNWHIIGDISLYKLGDGPRFILHFTHDGMDGYNFNSIGRGYSFRNDLIETSITANIDKLRIDAEGYYQDRNHGLQGVSSYGSLTHRFFGVSGDADFQMNELFGFSGGLDFSGVNRDLSGTEPVVHTELSVIPYGKVLFEWKFLTSSFSLDYQLRSILEADSFRHSLNTELYLGVELPLAMNLDGAVALEWDFIAAPAVPFWIAFSGSVKELFVYRVEGGYEYVRNTMENLWEQYSFLDASGVPADKKGWFSGVNLRVIPIPELEIFGGGRFETGTGIIWGNPETPLSGSGLIGWENRDYLRLALNSGIKWAPVPEFSAALDWSGQILEDKDPFQAAHTLHLALNGQDSKETFGGGLNVTWDIAAELPLPNISLNGFFRVTEGIEMTVEAQDILAPVYENGRPGWGNLIEPGFDFIFKARISL